MQVSAEFIAQEPGQTLLRGFLRASLKLCFRGLIQPPMPIALQRGILRLLSAACAPLARRVPRSVDSLAGVRCEWHRPKEAADDNILLYLHGGGYLLGSPASHRPLCGALAHAANMSLCVPEYRLSPEARLPAAVDDALAVYRALRERYPHARIFIGGDSAGGHLTLCATLALAAAGERLPVSLVCLSPLVDPRCKQMHNPPAGDPMLNPRWLKQAQALSSPTPGPLTEEQVLASNLSPLDMDLSRLPPLLLQVGEDERLRNDSLRLAEQAQKVGVKVQLERYPGLWHVFHFHTGLLRQSDFAIGRIADFLQRQAATPGSAPVCPQDFQHIR